MLLAEILLSRTRAEVVALVIEELWARFPTPDHLAAADTNHIAQMIAPLGLQKRAGMLVESARTVAELGTVPSDREALLRLPGVGAYVADAVRLFGFHSPTIPVDAVIGRVLRRVFGYPSYGPAYADRSLWQAVQPLALYSDPRRTVASLLDLGAQICAPAEPLCEICPLRSICTYANAMDLGA